MIVQLSRFAKKHSSRELRKITEQTQLSFSGSSSYPHLQPSSFFSLLPSWHIMFHLFQTISWFTPKYFHVILISKCCMEYPLPGASSYKKLSFPEKRERYHTHTHTHMMKYYSAIKTEIMPFAATWMDLEMIILSEVSQTETNIMKSLTCGI